MEQRLDVVVVAVGPDSAAVAVTGRLDEEAAPGVAAFVADLRSVGKRHCILDLRGVTYVDTGAVAVLDEIVLTAVEAGGHLELIAAEEWRGRTIELSDAC